MDYVLVVQLSQAKKAVSDDGTNLYLAEAQVGDSELLLGLLLKVTKTPLAQLHDDMDPI